MKKRLKQAALTAIGISGGMGGGAHADNLQPMETTAVPLRATLAPMVEEPVRRPMAQPMAMAAPAAPVSLTAMVDNAETSPTALLQAMEQHAPLRYSIPQPLVRLARAEPKLEPFDKAKAAPGGQLVAMAKLNGQGIVLGPLPPQGQQVQVASAAPQNTALVSTGSHAGGMASVGAGGTGSPATAGVGYASTGGSYVPGPGSNGTGGPGTAATGEAAPPALSPAEAEVAAAAPNPHIPIVTHPDSQQLLLSLNINGHNRDAVIDAYTDSQGHLWLPLGVLAHVLEIPITVNAGAGKAAGWYQATTNTLNLDLAHDSMVIGGKAYPTLGMAERQAADIYITAEALEKWFGVTTSLNYNDLALNLHTPQPLPIEQRENRLQAWQMLARAREAAAIPSQTLVLPYSNLSVPLVLLNSNISAGHSAQDGNSFSSGFSIQSQNDILHASNNITLAFSQNNDEGYKFNGGSVLLQRQSHDADLLGPLKARYFGVGDITTVPPVLSNLETNGRGVRVNNQPLDAVENPDQYVITGPAAIGWDVELYQNQTLVAFTHVDNSGRYSFTALPLQGGLNTFRIVLYGPHGEREEKQQSIYLADNIPGKGEWRYDTAVYQPGQTLIPGGHVSVSDTTIAQTQLAYGLSKNWGLAFSGYNSVGQIASSTEAGTFAQKQGAGAGLRGGWGNTYLTLDSLATEAGYSLQQTLRTTLYKTLGLRLSNANNYGYTAQERDLLSDREAEVTLPTKFGKANLSQSYSYRQQAYQSQPTIDTIGQRTGLSYKGLNLSNQLNHTLQAGNSTTTGTLEASTFVMGHGIRGSVNYGLTNARPDIQNFSVGTQMPVGDITVLNTTYTQQLDGTKSGALTNAFNWNYGPVAVGVTNQFTTRGDAQLGLNLGTALTPAGYNKLAWDLQKPNQGLGSARLAVRVYIDSNNNGKFDPGEKVLDKVNVLDRQHGVSAITDATGIATLADLTPFTPNRLELDIESLPGIYLKPVSDTVYVSPHPGSNGLFNYAVQMFGEVSGKLQHPNGEPITDTPLAITNAAGKQIDTVKTEDDGYYLFSNLPLGSYQIKAGNTVLTSTTIAPDHAIQVKVLVLRP